MEYITTFNATFFTAMISFVLAEIFFGKLFKLGIAFTTNYPRLALWVPAVAGILAVIGWLVWSIPGSTTAAFWGGIVTMILYKPIATRRTKIVLKAFDEMDVTHIKHA